MPELPEVQTIVDDLNKKVRGRKIVAAWYDWAKLKAVTQATGYTIKKVVRRGKNILFYLARRSPSGGDSILLVHQKMTGHLLVGKWAIEGKKVRPISPPALKEKVNTYIHFILTLDDGRMIGLSDLRKFGKVMFGNRKAIEKSKDLTGLGPDALDPCLKTEEFIARVGKRSKTIYQTLMDQALVAGMGNIYASDILWRSKIYPFAEANKLTKEQLRRIYESMRAILKRSVKLRGTSSGDYRDTAGEEGYYYKERRAYDREGLPCYECGTKIKRVKKSGRSAFYCPRCQK